MAEGWIDIDDIEGLQHFNTDLPFFPHPDHDTLTAEQIIDSDREADPRSIIIEDISYEYNLTTKAHKDNLHVETAIHTSLMPEYPQTSQDGFLYIISTSGIVEDQVKAWHRDIQYGKASSNNRTVKSSYLGDVLTTVRTYKCSGVKTCPHLDPTLNTTHEAVTDDWATRVSQVFQERSQIAATFPDAEETESYFQYLTNAYHCLPAGLCRGKVKIIKAATQSSAIMYRSTCTAYKRGDGIKHWFRNVNPGKRINYDYLAMLCTGTAIQRSATCSTIRNLNTSLSRCSVLHQNGYGTLVNIPCGVVFTTITPKDLKATPYILLHSRGIHAHPPPPPTKVPTAIREDINAIIQSGDTLNLTRELFLQSPALQYYLTSLNVRYPAQLHPAFTNQDRWTALLHKQRILLHPYGSDINAVLFEFERQKNATRDDPTTEQFIRAVVNEPEAGLIIVCFSEQQARKFLNLRFIELDMTFKRIHGVIHEIVFSTYLGDSEGNAAVSLARVYVNKNTVKMYHRVFQILFSSLGFGLQKPMWKHIHGDGFEGVTADMCAKQAEGLGKYLHDIDPSRSWRDHIQYILVFCLVHYNRNVQPFRRHPEFRTMRELPFMSSKQQALEYLAKWKLDPLIGGWAKHKSCSWILSGLNPAFSKMVPDVFRQIQRHTNTGESGHANVNRTGIHRSLLGGILSAHQHDNAILHRGIQFQITNVPSSSRSKDALTRHQRAATRRGTREVPFTINEEPDTPTPATRKRSRAKNTSQTEIDMLKERVEVRALELSLREREIALREKELSLQERERALESRQSMAEEDLFGDLPDISSIFN